MPEQQQLPFDRTRPANEDERKAIGMYAVLDRCFMDFIEMIPEESDETLRVLYLMLTTPNEKHSASDQELNALGAGPVARLLTKRGIELPEKLETPDAAS